MISVHRVYWYTDWVRGVKRALRELWRSLFGCHHKWETIRFQHLTHVSTGEWGIWAVNKCHKCGSVHPFASWQGPRARS